MTAGFQIINDSGIVQVDQDYKNVGLSAKGTLSGVYDHTPSGTTRPVYTYTLDVSAYSFPIVAIDATFPVAGYPRTQSTGIYKFISNQAGSFNYYIFSLTSPQYYSTENVGVQVFNGDGTLAFDSRIRYPKLVDVYITTGFTTVSHTYAAGRKYAVCYNGASYFVAKKNGQQPVGWVFNGVSVNDNVVWGRPVFDTESYNGGTEVLKDTNILVFDVTDI